MKDFNWLKTSFSHWDLWLLEYDWSREFLYSRRKFSEDYAILYHEKWRKLCNILWNIGGSSRYILESLVQRNVWYNCFIDIKYDADHWEDLGIQVSMIFLRVPCSCSSWGLQQPIQLPRLWVVCLTRLDLLAALRRRPQRSPIFSSYGHDAAAKYLFGWHFLQSFSLSSWWLSLPVLPWLSLTITSACLLCSVMRRLSHWSAVCLRNY